MAALLRWLAVGLCLLTGCHSALIPPAMTGQKALVAELRTPSEDVRSTRQLKIAQNVTICDAGSRHWTGHVPVREGRNMFYWYFERQFSPETAPLVIWTNGGPGGSSMLGAFFEIGPCRISEDGNTTSFNPFAWTRHANMLFIDQPIGVGLSGTASSSLWAKTLLQAGIDVDKFLDVFLSDSLFPELAGRPLHFAGESFGGKYVPVFVAMTDRRYDSIILVDPFIDPATHFGAGNYRHFCPATPGQRKAHGGTGSESGVARWLNETACGEMERDLGECERLARACRDTYDEDMCRLARDAANEVSKWWASEVGPGGRDMYDDRVQCGDRKLCHDMGQERTDVFFNLPHVKQALGLPDDFKYESINFEFNEAWVSQMIVPSTRELTTILDDKHTRVLVINGNNDGGINTESIKMILDELPWHGHAVFSRDSYDTLRYISYDREDGHNATGQFKRSGNLTVLTFDEASHMSVYDQAEASSVFFGWWLRQGAQVI